VTANITADKLKGRFPDSVLETSEFRDELTVVVRADDIVEICLFLRDDPELKYNYLVDATAIDEGVDASPRFIAVYHLLSHEFKNRVCLKAPIEKEPPEIDTVVPVWSTADWHEREAYDLIGVNFKGHPDLRRILLPEHWETHPLRKDYPIEGLGET
jgi:NADH-quinone oxidoreductase subunit C